MAFEAVVGRVSPMVVSAAEASALVGGAEPEQGPLSRSSGPVSSTIDRLKTGLRGAGKASDEDLIRSQLTYYGFQDGIDLIELMTLPVQKGSYHAFTTSHVEAVRLGTELKTERFGRLQPIEFSGVFLIINRHVAGFEAKHEHGRWILNDAATDNDDISHRRNFYLDLDTVRTNGMSGVSATDSELKTTLRAGFEKFAEFSQVLGNDNALGFKMSGNGVQIDFRLADLPETPELDFKIKFLLHVWAELFNTESYKIDTVVHDAKRIGPLAGTKKRKGADHRPEGRREEWRMHRRVLFVGPEKAEPLTMDRLDAFLAHYRQKLTPEQLGRIENKVKKEDTTSTPVPGTKPRVKPRLSLVKGGGDHPYKAADELPMVDVMTALGLVTNGSPTCPGCGHNDGSQKLNEHHVKCFRASCGERTFGVLGAVAKQVFGKDSVNHDTDDGRDAARQAYIWLAERFPLPRLHESRIHEKRAEVEQKLVEQPTYLDDRVNACACDTAEKDLQDVVEEIVTRSPVQQARLLLSLSKQTKLGTRVLRKLVQGRAEPDDDGVADPKDDYPIVNGSLCHAVQTEAGKKTIKLCNFSAQVAEVVTLDDGVEKKRFFKMEGATADGSPLPPVRVGADEFEAMKWVVPEWGPRAIIEPGNGVKDTLRAAIQEHSTEAPDASVYGHTGWRNVNGKWCYLHGGGAIGGADASVELTGKCSAFNFNTTEVSKDELLESVRMSCKLMDVAPARVATPLFCLTYAAPLAGLLRMKFSTWIIGESEALKSTLALELQRHFGLGFVDLQSLPQNFTSTPTAVEGTLFTCQDALVVVDDFCPKNSTKDSEKQRTLAEMIIRNVGNGATRERSRADLGAQASRPPRAAVLCTAEEDPCPAGSAASLSNRMLKLHLKKGDVKLNVLSELQASGDRPQVAMRAYIEWLAVHYEELKKTLPARYGKLITEIRAKEALRARQPDIIAQLCLAFELHSEFAVEVGAFSQDEADRRCIAVKKILVDVAAEQAKQDDERKPDVRYLDAIKTLLTSGRCKLEPTKNTLSASASCRDIGWFDKEYIYLEPTATHAEVMRLLGDAKETLAAGPTTLHQAMIDRGWVIRNTQERGRLIGKEPVGAGGARPRVLKMPVSVFEDVNIEGLVDLKNAAERAARDERETREIEEMFREKNGENNVDDDVSM